jgi:hypothetical protein
VARIAQGQHGVVTHRQLREVGLTAGAIERRIGKGSLPQEFRGVYRVGHRAPSLEARYIAAVFACGEGALLSGRAAAHLYGLIKGTVPPPEVTAPTERRVKGVTTHRSRTLDRRDATIVKGIPATTIPRTLVDLAATLTADDLARACHEAEVRYHLKPRQVEAVLARRPSARGATALRAILHGEARVSLSKLERGFLALLKREGLPLPITNKPAGGRYVDCRWPEHQLTVELDSYRFHSSRFSWEQDREREREARRRGDEFRRFTYEDVFVDLRYMLAQLGGLLA